MSDKGPVLPRLFKQHQSALLAALELARAVDHPTSKGDVSEAQWRSMLAKYLPQRYRVSKGQVVDSRGETSQQIDIIIHDAHYCPLFLEEGDITFVPAESVYAAFEVKQELTTASMEYAGGKAASVRRLFRTSAPILDRGEKRPPRPPTEILTGVLATATDWRDGLGESFRAAFEGLGVDEELNLGCVLGVGAFELQDPDDQLVVAGPDEALVTFFLRLVHRLQAIGTVVAIDWPSYIRAAVPPAKVLAITDESE